MQIELKNIETKKIIKMSLEKFIEQMNLSSELRDFKDNDFSFKIIKEKNKNTEAEKLEKLQKKYKVLAEKHRKDKQAEFPRKKQELQKVLRLKEIIYNLMDKAYDYIHDELLADTEIELEKIIKRSLPKKIFMILLKYAHVAICFDCENRIEME